MATISHVTRAVTILLLGGAIGAAPAASGSPAAATHAAATAAASTAGVRGCPEGVHRGPTTRFTAAVPAFGSKTDDDCFRTTVRFRDINLRLTRNPHDTWVKAVRCSDLRDIGRPRLIPTGSNRVFVLARNVPDGLCFRLNFSAPTPARYTVAGRVSA